MSYVYIVENGCVIGVTGGNLCIRYADKHEDTIPKATVEG